MPAGAAHAAQTLEPSVMVATNGARVTNRDALIPILRDILSTKPSKHWLEGLEKNNVSCGPINRLDQVFDDPQVQARGMKLHMDHPATGGRGIDMVGSPMRFSASPTSYRHAPPMLGQHTDEILKEVVNATEAEIFEWRAEGVI